MRRWTITLLGLLGAAGVLGGCSLADERGIAVHEAEPLKARLAGGEAVVADGRWLLVPHGLAEAKSKDEFLLGSWGISGSAWWGSGFGLGGHGDRGQWLNLSVVDLDSGRQARVFDRQVALRSWSLSLSGGDARELRYDRRLVLLARTADTNDDGQIDLQDDTRLYVYDLATWALSPLTPEGISVEQVRVLPRAGAGTKYDLVCLVGRQPNAQESAAYLVNVTTGEGAYAGEWLKP